MGDEMENAVKQADIPKSSFYRMRTNDDVVQELSHERCDLADKLEKLKAAINANPDFVSEKHKELLKKQAAAMEEYKRVLGERIKDLIGE